MPPPLSKKELEADRQRVRLAQSLQAVRAALHRDVDAFVDLAAGFLNNPLRDVLAQFGGTPAEAVEDWRQQVMAAKQQFLDQIEEQFRRLRGPSGEYVELLRTMTERLPAPVPPEDYPSFTEVQLKEPPTPGVSENPYGHLTLDQLGLGDDVPF